MSGLRLKSYLPYGRRWWMIVVLAAVLAIAISGAVIWWWRGGVHAAWDIEQVSWVATIFAVLGGAAAGLVRLVMRLRRRWAESGRPGWHVRVIGRVPPPAAWWQPRSTGLELARAARRGGSTTYVIAGMGGVGKTQLAAAFAREQLVAGRLDLLVWISATEVDAIVAGYAEAARSLGLVADEHDVPRAAVLFRTWLETTDRRWLVVFDDLVQPGDLTSWWPPATSRGRRVLVTTRRRDAALRAEGRTMLEVGSFTSLEALNYLLRALPNHRQAAEIAGLAADLGHLPLALSQAAAYLHDRRLSCAQYRDRLSGRQRQLSELLPERAALPDEQGATVAATWSLSVDLADQLKPTHLARPVLAFACLLDSNGIPLELFLTVAALEHFAVALGTEVGSDDARDALSNLHRLHLLTFDSGQAGKGAGEARIQVHALIQRAIRDQLTATAISRAARAAADALLEIWPVPERDPALCSALRANTAALYQHTGDTLLTPATHRVLFRAGESLGETGQITAAIDYFDRLLIDCSRVLGPDHRRTLSVRHSLAHWRALSGDVAGAAAAFETLVADRVRVLGPDHPETLLARGGFADRRGDAGDAVGAAAAFETLVADRVRVLGPDHPDTLYARANAARWRGLVGDTDTAVAALNALIPDVVRVLGGDHRGTLRIRNNLAYLRGEAGDAVGAVAAFETLVADRVRVLGPSHQDTLRARRNLAYWQGASGDVAGAVAALVALIPDVGRILGPDHPDARCARKGLAYLRGESRDAVSAAEALESLIPELANLGGIDHPTPYP